MSSAIKSVNRLIRAAVIMAVALVTFVACQDRVDESNMYTFTGKLMSGYMEEDEGLSDFLYLIRARQLHLLCSQQRGGADFPRLAVQHH